MNTAGTIKKTFGLFLLIFSLVFSSHASVLDLVVDCPHHTGHQAESAHAQQDPGTGISAKAASASAAADSECPCAFRCHNMAPVYCFPSGLAELSAVPEMNIRSPLSAHLPAAPVLDGPFQPPRSA